MSRRKASKYSKSELEYNWVAARSSGQQFFLRSMDENDITIVKGKAGTGKTLLALQTGLKLYQLGEIDKIYYVRNDVGDDLGSKDLGALPGDKEEKLFPLLGPIIDNIYQICSPGKAKYIMEKQIVEVIPFEYLRGRSLKNKFIISDESQNVPPKGILTLLTRMAEGSKLVIIGDPSQKDSRTGYSDGLKDCWLRLRGLPGIGFVELGYQDVQRKTIIVDIMKRYKDIAA